MKLNLYLFFFIFLPFINYQWPGEKTTLDGSRSYDKEGYIAAYHWQQISGPQSNIVHPDSAITEVNSIKDVGIYIFELSVTNNHGVTAKDSVYITAYKGALSVKLDSVRKVERIKDFSIKSYFANGNLNITIRSPKIQVLDAEIYDVAGRLLSKNSLSVMKGESTFRKNYHLATGIYFLRLHNYFINETQKIVIVN